MGCSPSKGKLLLKPHNFGIQKTRSEGADCGPAVVELQCKEEESPPLTEEHNTNTSFLTLVDSDRFPENAMDNKVTEVNEMSQELLGDFIQADLIQKMETQKKTIEKRSTERQRKCFVTDQTKVDFPPHVVRALQGAYNFLNPNISKYETLLGLLDQANKTRLSLQPMISAIGLCFEEINQALEDMAEDGELMLKEHGDSMTLPSRMLGEGVRSAKPCTTTADHFYLPPDILQQLLQRSEQIRQVSSSVKNLSDSALEKVIEYLSCLSKQFAEKLQAKQTAELRLAHILARIEATAIRKSNPEDSALHSEDSGIGGESESLTGSEQHQCNRGSAGSGSFGSEVNIWGMAQNVSNNLASFVTCNEDDEDQDKEEEEEHVEKHEDDANDSHERKRSSFSPPGPCNTLHYMNLNSIRNQQSTYEQLFTSTKAEDSSSNSGINVISDLLKSQKELNKKMKKISEMQRLNDFARPHCNFYQNGLRRHSLNELTGVHKSQMRTNMSPCSLFSSPLPPKSPLKQHSVRRLINTFTQGLDGRPGQNLSDTSHHIMRLKKNFNLAVSNIVNSTGGDIVSCNNSRSCPDGRDDLNMDNLPPPPLEVLMDNSFRHDEGELQNENIHNDPLLSLPFIHQNSGISRRRKIAMQNVEVLPNKANVKPKSIAISPAPPMRKERVTEGQHKLLQFESEMSEKTEETKRLYKQARQIIHLCNAGESPDNKNIVVQSSGDLTSLQATHSQRCENNEMLESDMHSCNLPVIAPPASRVRFPPSSPSVCHNFPSPPVFRQRSISRSSSLSTSPKTVAHANDNSTEHISPSVSFHDARSVFCQNEVQSFQTCLSIRSSELPRKWGGFVPGRLSTRGRDNPMHHCQSEQRPGMSSYSELEIDHHLISQQTKKDESVAEK
ncbi:uncharacterized protein LOC105923203 [Fundulus heteroclitus]|uniref:uncharacterized protein LOC105923203 n=1 Tax=Fundulus heteroclitus TaxID=8078 RepID=UPI00165BFB4E|nr:uncharacterized protein LOC105923203 [Fundulus heteroclitus]